MFLFKSYFKFGPQNSLPHFYLSQIDMCYVCTCTCVMSVHVHVLVVADEYNTSQAALPLSRRGGAVFVAARCHFRRGGEIKEQATAALPTASHAQGQACAHNVRLGGLSACGQ